MAIAKRPHHIPPVEMTPDQERAAAAFIAGADPQAPPRRTTKVPILVRFDRDLLRRVDQAARRRGVSRSGWIQYQVSRALEAEEASI
jgi:hypothetical protein